MCMRQREDYMFLLLLLFDFFFSPENNFISDSTLSQIVAHVMALKSFLCWEKKLFWNDWFGNVVFLFGVPDSVLGVEHLHLAELHTRSVKSSNRETDSVNAIK